MDKISLLRTRKQKLLNAGKKIRKDISELVDEKSFVEFSAFSFSKNSFYDENADGEGIVCGFATISEFPVYIIAQNYEIFCGGVSKAACDKMCKCLDMAEKASASVIYLMSTHGVQVGERVNVLEGLASLILKASQLKGTVRQYMIVNGEVYGQIALLSAICDFTFFMEGKSVLSHDSPLVLSAKSNKNLTKLQVGGAEGLIKANLAAFCVKNLDEVKNKIVKIGSLLSSRIVDCETLNDSVPALDKKVDGKAMLSVFDDKEFIEVGASYSPEVKCVLGRIGGITVAVTLFYGDGVRLTCENVRKIKDFAEFACCYSLPYVTFVNTLGIQPDIETADSLVLKEIADYVYVLDCIDGVKISVVYKKAIGLGYTLFAAKSMGYDYTIAFANAEISLFDSIRGAEIEFSVNDSNRERLAARYSEENSDPVNAAENGYIDDIIQPSFVRQYLISALQMLKK